MGTLIIISINGVLQLKCQVSLRENNCLLVANPIIIVAMGQTILAMVILVILHQAMDTLAPATLVTDIQVMVILVISHPKICRIFTPQLKLLLSLSQYLDFEGTLGDIKITTIEMKPMIIH